VLHDISIGGIAVALAEIAIKSRIGLQVEGIPGPELFDETPLRFIAVAHGDDLNTRVAHKQIGIVGGDTIDFGDTGSIDLADATYVWKNALPRRMR
jgi:phosphoribosylformylglycinamidine synthase